MKQSICQTSRSIFLTVFVALLFLMACSFPAPCQAAPAAENENCLNCHQDLWDREIVKRFVHAPFQDKQCLFCHVVGYSSSPNSRESQALVADVVQWIEKFKSAATSHWFEFKAENREATLLLEANDNKINRTSREIVLAPLSDLPEPPTYTSPPRITDVRIGKVSMGVLNSVAITWKTDRPTNAVVFYGEKKMNLTSEYSYNYTTEHTVTITCAKQCLNYRYKVVCEDVSGLRTVSDEIYPLNLPTSAEDEVGGEGNASSQIATGRFHIEYKMFRHGDRYLINVNADRPVQVALGIRYDTVAKPPPPDEGTRSLRHVITADQSYTNMRICYKCHRESEMVKLHPVNLYPKKGMIVSADYSLLADGRITCTTCHTPHASDFQFRTVKDRNQELCLGCHPAKTSQGLGAK